jgi:hypothetical protein
MKIGKKGLDKHWALHYPSLRLIAAAPSTEMGMLVRACRRSVVVDGNGDGFRFISRLGQDLGLERPACLSLTDGQQVPDDESGRGGEGGMCQKRVSRNER